jgi:hypothetical protein
MNITSAQYVNEYDFDGTTVLNSNIHIEATIDGTEMSVPIDTANRHYVAILEWAADGNTIQDAD